MGNGCTSQKSASLVNLNRDRIPSFKVILLGDSGVGKSSIIQRFRRNQFEEEYTPTKIVAIDNIVKKLNVPQNVLVSLAIWDIPSREDMDMGKTYYHNVDAVFVVVDLSEKDSIEMAGIWRQDFLNKASRSREIQTTLPKGGHIISLEPDKSFNPKDVPIILLGNKFDLVDSVDEVEREDVQEQVDEFLLSAEDADPAEKDGSVQDKEGNENTGETKITLGPTRDQDPVALLQEIEKHYYFATSIPVSAKSKDGSVDEAFQAVIKHLLDKSKNFWPKLPNESVSRNEKKKKRKRHHPEFEVHLEKLAATGRNELDNLYHKCNNPMKRCQRYQRIYEGCLRRFMLRCVELQFLTDTRVDLQQCMMAIKEYVQKHMSRPLMVKEEDHFLKIYYDFDEVQDVTLLKQQRVFNKFLERFHKEFVAVCNGVMLEGSYLVERLSIQKRNILDIVDNLKEQRDSDEDDDSETEWLDTSEENLERIQSSVKAMEDTFKMVEKAKNTIQSTLSTTEPEQNLSTAEPEQNLYTAEPEQNETPEMEQ